MPWCFDSSHVVEEIVAQAQALTLEVGDVWVAMDRSLLEHAIATTGQSELLPLFIAADLHDRHLVHLSGTNGYTIVREVGVASIGIRLDLCKAFKDVVRDLDSGISPAKVTLPRAVWCKLFTHLGAEALTSVAAASQCFRDVALSHVTTRAFIPDRWHVTFAGGWRAPHHNNDLDNL